MESNICLLLVFLDISHLLEDLHLQVRAIYNFEVFQENPGRTNIVEHDVREDAIFLLRDN